MRYAGNDYYCDIVLKDTSSFKIEYESSNVLAYHHTNPYWPVHVVVIPKKHISSFTDRKTEDDIIMTEIFEVIRIIATKIEKETGAARILTNLGEYQESKHLHFHISSGDQLKQIFYCIILHIWVLNLA